MLWWQDDPTPPTRFRADAHDVELLLLEAEPPRTNSPLVVQSALLLSGSLTSTVLSIELLDESFDVRAPQLPLTVSSDNRFESVSLRISVGDCSTATSWQASDRPFTITWRDGLDRKHTDRAGDFDRSMGKSLVRYVDAVCDN